LIRKSADRCRDARRVAATAPLPSAPTGEGQWVKPSFRGGSDHPEATCAQLGAGAKVQLVTWSTLLMRIGRIVLPAEVEVKGRD
jgi:hypothetical protein